MITTPFYQLIDPDSPVWSIIDKSRFSTLYPQGVEIPDEIKENINSNFYYREIAFSSPTKFLNHFQLICRERVYTWKKLLETEKVLRDEDMLYNYDLTEESTDERNTKNNSRSEFKPETKTKTTSDNQMSDNTDSTTRTLPNLKTETENTISGKVTPNQNIENSTSHNETLHSMDTPDGITNDIGNYLSQAQRNIYNDVENTKTTGETKNEQKTTDIQKQTGESDARQFGKHFSRQNGITEIAQSGKNTTESESNNNDKNDHKLRRYGNIGVMTSAQILGGFRDAQNYDVFSQVIYPDLEHLFLSVIDLDSIDLW